MQNRKKTNISNNFGKYKNTMQGDFKNRIQEAQKSEPSFKFQSCHKDRENMNMQYHDTEGTVGLN